MGRCQPLLKSKAESIKITLKAIFLVKSNDKYLTHHLKVVDKLRRLIGRVINCFRRYLRKEVHQHKGFWNYKSWGN